jgi:hypothetical protein
MPSHQRLAGSASQTVYLLIRDATTQAGLTGLAFDTAGLKIAYTRTRAAAPVLITLTSLATPSSAWLSGGFIEVDDTTAPGLYRFDVPDAALVETVDVPEVQITWTGASSLEGIINIELVGNDPFTGDASVNDIVAAVYARAFPKLGNGTLTAAQVLTLLAAPFANKSSGPARGNAGSVAVRNGADNANIVSQTVDANGYHTGAPTLNLGGS